LTDYELLLENLRDLKDGKDIQASSGPAHDCTNFCIKDEGCRTLSNKSGSNMSREDLKHTSQFNFDMVILLQEEKDL